jgi:hypothetical protein
MASGEPGAVQDVGGPAVLELWCSLAIEFSRWTGAELRS